MSGATATSVMTPSLDESAKKNRITVAIPPYSSLSCRKKAREVVSANKEKRTDSNSSALLMFATTSVCIG